MKIKRGGVTAKHINTRIKSAEDAPDDNAGDVTDEGVFTGYASVFGNTDSYGEVVVKGAFAESLEAQPVFPVYWSHQMSDPMMNIGKTLEISEDDHGLFVKAQLDLETPMGAQVHRLIKDGRVNQMSFAFDVEDFKQAKSADGGEDIVELHKLKLHEVSVVQVGANQATELLDVKSRVTHVKASTDLSDDNEGKLDKAIALIQEVIADSSTSEEDDDDTSTSEDSPTPPPGADEEPKDGGQKSRILDPDAALAHLFILTEGVHK